MTHHGAALRRLTGDETLVRELASGLADAPISPAERAMLEYAIKLTRTPWAVREEDVERLRRAGWDDRAILDMASIVAYFNFVNRLAEGLGVSLEAYWREEERLEPGGDMRAEPPVDPVDPCESP